MSIFVGSIMRKSLRQGAKLAWIGPFEMNPRDLQSDECRATIVGLTFQDNDMEGNRPVVDIFTVGLEHI